MGAVDRLPSLNCDRQKTFTFLFLLAKTELTAQAFFSSHTRERPVKRWMQALATLIFLAGEGGRRGSGSSGHHFLQKMPFWFPRLDMCIPKVQHSQTTMSGTAQQNASNPHGFPQTDSWSRVSKKSTLVKVTSLLAAVPTPRLP